VIRERLSGALTGAADAAGEARRACEQAGQTWSRSAITQLVELFAGFERRDGDGA
jgi:hypothetical protein